MKRKQNRKELMLIFRLNIYYINIYVASLASENEIRKTLKKLLAHVDFPKHTPHHIHQ